MRAVYLDIFSGISGDMFIGAMIDLGVDVDLLKEELRKLALDGYHITTARRDKSNIVGVKFDVHLTDDEGKDCASEDHDHSHGHDHGHTHGHDHSHSHGSDGGHSHDKNRDFKQIKSLIWKSQLSEWVKQKSIAVFQRVAVAEGKVHGLPPEEVHFHEVGAVDSIVDIVGACIALEILGCPKVLSAPVVEGTGWVKCAHGRFPIPTAATLEILGARGIPITQCDEPHELVTPTGAAILAEFAESFAPMAMLATERVGYGLGTRDNKTRPNVLRAVLTKEYSPADGAPHDWETDRIAVLETNLDDIPAEVLGNLVEKALEAGALDIFHTPIQMKKNRPGVMLTILCQEKEADRFTELLLKETSAFGVRRTMAERRKLRREIVAVTTPFGAVEIKVGRLDGKPIQKAPEYENCKRLAYAADVPVKEVIAAAQAAAISQII